MLSQPLIKVRQSQINDQKCKTYDFAWSCNFTSFSSTAARSLSKPWENLNVDNIKRGPVAWLTCSFMWYVYFYALILVLTFVKAIWDYYDFDFILFSLEHVHILSDAGRAFFRPWEDLRRVGERFSGLWDSLSEPDPLQTSRRQRFIL